MYETNRITFWSVKNSSWRMPNAWWCKLDLQFRSARTLIKYEGLNFQLIFFISFGPIIKINFRLVSQLVFRSRIYLFSNVNFACLLHQQFNSETHHQRNIEGIKSKILSYWKLSRQYFVDLLFSEEELGALDKLKNDLPWSGCFYETWVQANEQFTLGFDQ